MIVLIISRWAAYHVGICDVELLYSGQSFRSGGGTDANEWEHHVFLLSAEVLPSGASQEFMDQLRKAFGNEGFAKLSNEQVIEAANRFLA